MIIFFWIVAATIVASTSVALLCCKKSEMTLSEIAEKLESGNLHQHSGRPRPEQFGREELYAQPRRDAGPRRQL
jgi:hypothetical protein